MEVKSLFLFRCWSLGLLQDVGNQECVSWFHGEISGRRDGMRSGREIVELDVTDLSGDKRLDSSLNIPSLRFIYSRGWIRNLPHVIGL